METDFEYDVFLSHSSKDKPTVRELAERLKADGLHVWFDEWIIKPGDLIGLKIERGLEQSRTLVLVMSAGAFASEWVTLERHTALFRDPTNAQRRFIPLRLDDTEIKDMLRQFAYVDWRQKPKEQYNRLVTVCRAQSAEEFNNRYPNNILATSKKKLVDHNGGVWGVAVSIDGHIIVSGSDDRTVRVWEIESGRCIRVLRGHSKAVFTVAITQDKRYIISGSEDKTLRIWDVKSGKCLAILTGHLDSVVGVAITPNGRIAVSGSWDKTIRVWDVESGQCLRILQGHTDPVVGVAVTPDGQRAISGSNDETVRVWDVALSNG